MTTTLSPVVLSADIITPNMRHALSEVFAISGAKITGVTLAFYKGRNEIVMGGESHLFIKSNDITAMLGWDDIRSKLTLEESSIVARAFMTLLSATHLSDYLERLDLKFANKDHPFISMTFFENVIIVSQDGFDEFAYSLRESIKEHPSEPKYRAPICTMLVPPFQSQHARLSQASRLDAVLVQWRDIHFNTLAVIEETSQIKVGNIDPVELAAIMA